MFCVVILENSKKLLVVPAKNCEIIKIKSAAIFNTGVKPNKRSKIFYSKKGSKVDFSLTVTDSAVFDEEKCAVYYGHILKIFGKYFFLFYDIF